MYGPEQKAEGLSARRRIMTKGHLGRQQQLTAAASVSGTALNIRVTHRPNSAIKFD